MRVSVSDWEFALQRAKLRLPDIDAATQELQRLGLVPDRHLNASREAQISLGKLGGELPPDIRCVIAWQVRGILGGIQMLARWAKNNQPIPEEWKDEIVQMATELLTLMDDT